jgi:hypothetical protein
MTSAGSDDSFSRMEGGDEVKQGAILRAYSLWGFFILRRL